MAIDLATGFNIGSKDAIDERQVLTLEQMKNLDENVYPDNYFSICKDDGKLYLYNSSNEVNDETGKFRVLSGGTGGGDTTYVLPPATDTTLGGVKVDNVTITVDSEGVITAINSYTKTEVDDLLNNKLDKPAVDGTAGQILVLQDDGSLAYQDNVSSYDDTELRGLIDTKIDKPAIDGVENDILSLDVDGNPIWISNPKEMPEYTVDDIDKVLKVNAAGDGLEWSAAASGGGDATEMETTELTSSALGGIPVGEDLNGMTSIEILTMMLYPYVKPTISATGTPNGGTFEVGDTQTITNVKVVITKKSKKIIKVEVFDGATSLGLLEDDTIANGGTFDFPVNVEVASVNTQLTATVTDEQGSEVSAKTGTFTFVNPFYVGVSDINTLTETNIIALTKKVEVKGNKTINYTTAQSYMVFAYPSSYGAIKSIIDQNGFNVTDSFTRNTVTVNSAEYYVYVSNKCSGTYTMKFNY